MSSQSPIFVRTEAFMAWLFEHTRKFARHERFRLAQRLDDTLFQFHECILRAGQHAQPRPLLLEADIQLDKLRAYLRLAVELGYTTPDQYAYVAKQVVEIGKLLGGWLKTC
jgi:hypothetical protein